MSDVNNGDVGETVTLSCFFVENGVYLKRDFTKRRGVMWEGIDRRRFPRANYKCIIRVKTGVESTQTIETHTENIGIGGICVVLKEDITLFKNVALEIVLQNGDSPAVCNGAVVWVVKKTDPKDKNAVTYDTGIEFVNIKEADKKRIASIVEKILPSS